jgi:hypothetical protein
MQVGRGAKAALATRYHYTWITQSYVNLDIKSVINNYIPTRVLSSPLTCLSVPLHVGFLMLFSRKNIIRTGKKPLYAASRVLNASSATASSAFTKCWVHSTNKTSAIFRSVRNQGFRRAYSSQNGGEGSSGTGFEKGLPFYRVLYFCRV